MRPSTLVQIIASLPAIVLLAAIPARAQTAATDVSTAEAASADDSGQKAAIDPATGRLRALTPDEARALIDSVARSVSQSGDGLTLLYHSNGAISIDLENRFESASLVRMESDGSLTVQCVTTAAEAETFLRAGVAAVKPAAQTVAPKPAPKTTAPASLEEK
jgi:hypothetical protein